MNDEFFVVGGTLRSDAPSYVERAADEELLRLAASGHLCYVLTTRQMGKSSLMTRTARRLQEQGMATAVLDLTGIGTADGDAWYLSLLDDLQGQLHLSPDVEAWWEEQAHLSQARRFSKFMQEVALAECPGQVVIFIDEVDSALNLPFSDDFFAVIRAIYNRETAVSPLSRLSFILLGVAAPHDLIKDQQRTPFNIGERITLAELALDDARRVFASALPAAADDILQRIFYWTGGHPYLTQKVGQAIQRSGQTAWDNATVDRLVTDLFFSERALTEESNLRFVSARILGSPQRKELLALYGRIQRGQRIANDERDPIQAELKLYGLVQPQADGLLAVRNLIYAHVFNASWLKQQQPRNHWRALALALTVLVILSLSASLYFWRQSRQTADLLAENYRASFATQNPTLRLDALANLLALPGYETEATSLFGSLPPSQQAALFDAATPDMQAQVETLANATYMTLGTADLTQPAETMPVLKAMLTALNQLPHLDNPTLPIEIASWLKGRTAAFSADYDTARIEYSVALSLNAANPATRFERAWVAAALGDVDTAVTDLQTLAADETWREPVRALIAASPQLQTAISEGASDDLAALVTLPPATATPTLTVPMVVVGETAVFPTAAPSPQPSPTTLPAPTATAAVPLIPLVDEPLPAAITLPDGPIVYTCFVGDVDQICTIGADGSDFHQLTFGAATSWYPSFALDEQAIFFSGRQSNAFGIYRLPLDGGEAQLLLAPREGDYAPALSPDGTQIAFTRAEGGNQNIWLAASDGSRPHPLTDVQGDALNPDWSPDGRYIAFARRDEGAEWFTLAILDVVTGEVRVLQTAVPYIGGRSDWSPDGRWLAFYAGLPDARNLYVVAVDSSEVRQITHSGDNLAPAFSPDGNWLVFTSHRDGDNELFLVRLDGTGLIQLTFNETADWQPRWGP